MKIFTFSQKFFALIACVLLVCNSSAFAQENPQKDAISLKTILPIGEEMIMYFASDEFGLEEIEVNDLEITGLDQIETIPTGGGFRAHITSPDITVSVKNEKRMRHIETTFGRITSLDLSRCPELVSLDCQVNQLESLDLSKTPKLKVLVCNRNKLKSLELKNHSELKSLDCGTNELTTLELPAGKTLISLFCMENKLTSLDLTKCEGLTKLSCPLNKIEKIAIRKGAPFESVFFYSNAMSAQSTHELIGNLGDGIGNNPDNPNPAPLIVINTLDENEKNVCYEEDVRIALAKNYKVYDNYNENDGFGLEYKGSPSAVADITAPSIALYPNPATEYVIVETLPYTRVLLLDAQGALLIRTATDDAGKARLDVSGIAQGTYIVKTAQGSTQVIVK
ncbi:MAG: T9SS type A sorting domain-containing protein [Porphyromonas sp.]|nr:T9SS type A sorting domain-containing protein [Porphyromonas sp.]